MRAFHICLLTVALTACSGSETADNASNAAAPAPAQEPVKVVSMAAGSTIDKAADAAVGTAVAGEIVPEGQSNFYRFTYNGDRRDIILVRLQNKSTTLKPDIKFYNGERSNKSEKYDGTPGASVEQSLSLDPGETFYVEVLPYGSAGAYELSAVAQKAFDANEPNDDQLKTTQIKFGDAVEGSIMDDKDSDWFHVTPATSGKITVALENLSTTLKPDVKIYSAKKSLITEKYDSTPGAGLDFTVDVEAGRDFYIEILPYGSTGKYRLTTRAALQAADMATTLKNKQSVSLYGIYFDTDQTIIKPESDNTLTEVSNVLKSDSALRLEVAGHTDNSGTKSHNMTLSQGRAEAVVQALVSRFSIDGGRLVAKGYGDTKPVAPNDNATGMAKNRRVELRRI